MNNFEESETYCHRLKKNFRIKKVVQRKAILKLPGQQQRFKIASNYHSTLFNMKEILATHNFFSWEINKHDFIKFLGYDAVKRT